MSKPIVAIVGRPNVGKSTLFNRIAGKRIAIVEDIPGVTRDRIYADAEWNGISFGIIDTGGIEDSKEDKIAVRVREQAKIAMEMADVILFICDGKAGITSSDEEVASILKKTGKKVILLVNKVDEHRKMPDTFYDFYNLGFGEVLPISAANMMNLGDVLDCVVESFEEGNNEENEAIKVAVIGKPNVGKSSLVNALLKEDRVIVSDIAGTTRDSIDAEFIDDGKRFCLIDTAGIRRKNKVSEILERYSVIRAIAAIERSDVCVMMIDATEGFTEQDKKIAGIAHESGRGVIIAVNKWDLLEKETGTMSRFKKKIEFDVPFLSYAPIIFISVKDRIRIDQIPKYANAVYNNCSMRVPTGQLNSLIQDAIMIKQPPSDKGKRLKIYYVSQIGIKPPLFAFQVNDRELMHFSYSRFLENRIREGFGFEGTSIKFVFREKREKK